MSLNDMPLSSAQNICKRMKGLLESAGFNHATAGFSVEDSYPRPFCFELYGCDHFGATYADRPSLSESFVFDGDASVSMVEDELLSFIMNIKPRSRRELDFSIKKITETFESTKQMEGVIGALIREELKKMQENLTGRALEHMPEQQGVIPAVSRSSIEPAPDMPF